MNEAMKDAFEKNLDSHEQMKAIAQAFKTTQNIV